MENVNKNKKRGRPSKIKDEFTPFATRLRSLGENMTHQEIADGVGVSRQTIGQFTLGNTRPDIDTLGKLADFFGVSTDYLLCRTDIKSTDTTVQDICEYTGLSENAINSLRKIKTAQYSKPVQEYSKNIVVTKLMTAPDNYNQKLLDILSLIISNSKFSDMLQAFQRLKEYHSNKKDNLTYEEEKQLTEILNNENVKLLHKANRWVVTGEGYEKEIKSTIYDTLQNIINEILADDKN